jgi:RNA polymerase sigma factor (sigma-70 family)
MVEARKQPEGVNSAHLSDAVAQVRASDPAAWGELYKQHAAAIYRFCRRTLRTREDAEDATMEIFVKVREKLGQYDESRPFRAWLYTVAANHCWDTLRRRRVRQDLESGDVESLPLEHPDPNQLEQLTAQRSREELRAALAELPERARLALVLRYYAEMNYDEIAKTLGVQRTFVGVVLLRARHQFREILTRHGASGADLETKGKR